MAEPTSADRPYRQLSYYDLEGIYSTNVGDLEVLNEILRELSFRSRPYSFLLRLKVNKQIEDLSKQRKMPSKNELSHVDRAKIIEAELALAQREVEILLKDREWLRSRLSELCARYLVDVGDEVKLYNPKERRIIEYKIAHCASDPSEVGLATPFAQAVIGREIGEKFDVNVNDKCTEYTLVGLEKPNAAKGKTWIAINLRPLSFF